MISRTFAKAIHHLAPKPAATHYSAKKARMTKASKAYAEAKRLIAEAARSGAT